MSFWFFHYVEAIYLNDCVISGQFLSNRVAAYLIIEEFFFVTII